MGPEAVGRDAGIGTPGAAAVGDAGDCGAAADAGVCAEAELAIRVAVSRARSFMGRNLREAVYSLFSAERECRKPRDSLVTERRIIHSYFAAQADSAHKQFAARVPGAEKRKDLPSA